MKGFSNKTSVVSIDKLGIDPKQISKSGCQNEGPLNQEMEYLAAVLVLHFSDMQQNYDRVLQSQCQAQSQPMLK